MCYFFLFLSNFICKNFSVPRSFYYFSDGILNEFNLSLAAWDIMPGIDLDNIHEMLDLIHVRHKPAIQDLIFNNFFFRSS